VSSFKSRITCYLYYLPKAANLYNLVIKDAGCYIPYVSNLEIIGNILSSKLHAAIVDCY
jgi:hypothetical protein